MEEQKLKPEEHGGTCAVLGIIILMFLGVPPFAEHKSAHTTCKQRTEHSERLEQKYIPRIFAQT